jgi:hypothetical protein
MPAEPVIRKPVNASMAEASGLAGVGCTAIQAAEAADALGRWSGQVGIEVEDRGTR